MSGAAEQPDDEKPEPVSNEQEHSKVPSEDAKRDQEKAVEDQTNKDATKTEKGDEKGDEKGEDVKVGGTADKTKTEEATDATAAPNGQAEKTEQKQSPETNGTESEAIQSKEETKAATANGNAVEPDAREADPPSSILEKGIIYFFFRARVNVDDPQDVKDIARTYMIMRPIPLDAKIGEGPIGDEANCRLLTLPKKVLPVSSKDRFMIFVEKAKTGFSDLKESFMTGSDYVTKTTGTSHTPPVTPLAEGVYAITSTGRESHLAYIINIPNELGEVQKDLGLKERGSFVASVKNPTQPAPNNASLPKGPDYPQEILDEFRNLRWKPLEPKHLDFVNTQFLIIGESYESAIEQRSKDEREDSVPPEEEIEKLEGEDEIRIKHLKGEVWRYESFLDPANLHSGDDTVFEDLGITSKDFPKVQLTW